MYTKILGDIFSKSDQMEILINDETPDLLQITEHWLKINYLETVNFFLGKYMCAVHTVEIILGAEDLLCMLKTNINVM